MFTKNSDRIWASKASEIFSIPIYRYSVPLGILFKRDQNCRQFFIKVIFQSVR